jgi:hypothetical protein
MTIKTCIKIKENRREGEERMRREEKSETEKEIESGYR